MVKEEIEKKYIFMAIIGLLLVLSFFMLRPYLISIISAFILAYLLRPLSQKLNKKFSKNTSAIICILLLVVILVLPAGLIITGITSQAYSSLNSEGFKTIISSLSEYPALSELGVNVENLTSNIVSLLVFWIRSIASYLPTFVINLIIILLGIYYTLTNWEALTKKLKDYIPFKNKDKVAEEINSSTKAIVYGSVLIALIEFAISALGFYISGVQFYLFLALIVAIFAFIPGLGPTLVWVPMAIYYGLTQNYIPLLGIIITGLVLSIWIDTIARGKIVGEKSKINPFIVIIGILGGISLFGIFGFIIGPLLLVYTIKLIEEVLQR